MAAILKSNRLDIKTDKTQKARGIVMVKRHTNHGTIGYSVMRKPKKALRTCMAREYTRYSRSQSTK